MKRVVLLLIPLLAACNKQDEERTIDKIVDDLQLQNDIESTQPRNCVSTDGKIYVVWQDTRHDEKPKDDEVYTDIFFNTSSDNGLTWLPSPIQLNNASARAMNPSIACSGDTVYVAWEDERDGDLAYHNIYVDVSTNGGRQFLDKDIALDNDPEGDWMSLAPQIVADGDSAYVTWFDQRNGAYDVFVQATTDKGASWLSEPSRVDTDDEGSAWSSQPKIAASGGQVVVVWEDRRDGVSDIYANWSDNNARSFSDRDIRLDKGADGSNSFLPRVTMQGSNVWAVWHDERSGKPDIFLSRSTDGGASWLDAPIRVDSDTEGVNTSTNPIVLPIEDGIGVVWQDNRLGGNDILFRLSQDGGDTWFSEEVRMDTDAGGESQSTEPVMIVDGKRVVVGWMDYRYDGHEDGSDDLFYNYSEDGGQTFQRSDIRINSNTPGATYTVDLGLGLFKDSLVTTWADGRSGATRIYFADRKLGEGSVYIEPEE